MARRLPPDVVWTNVVIERDDLFCCDCGQRLHIKKLRRRRVFTLEGPICYVLQLMHCPETSCGQHCGTVGPEQEPTLALPRRSIGWDVFCWLGHRRFARHWSAPQLRWELEDRYKFVLSADAIEDCLLRYQCMAAARQQDFARLKVEYAKTRTVTLPIDGLQPEKGHETPCVVREPGRERVWFARPLLSGATEEIRPLIEQANDWAKRLGCRVRLWISDKQDAFVKSIASVCPGVPHRYCGNHFLRDVAKPMLELDSHAKVQMRRKIETVARLVQLPAHPPRIR